MSEVERSKSFFQRHWDGYKEFWGDRFSFLDNYTRFLYPDKPLPHWNSSDVEEFVASDPVHGPTLKSARDAAQVGGVGAVIGAVSTAGFAWKYSKSPHGMFCGIFIFYCAALSLAFGAVVGGTFGIEVANHWFQLYRLDTMASQVKFYEWLQNRAGRQS